MACIPLKEHSGLPYPKTLLTIVVSVGGLAAFLVLASSLLVSQPMGYAVQNYFYGVDSSQSVDLMTSVNESVFDSSVNSNVVGNEGKTVERNSAEVGQDSGGESDVEYVGKGDEGKKNRVTDSLEKDASPESGKAEQNDKPSSAIPNAKSIGQHSSEISDGDSEDKRNEVGKTDKASDFRHTDASSGSVNSTMQINQNDDHPVPSSDENSDQSSNGSAQSRSVITNPIQADSIDSECDLYHGKWVYDTAGPLYTNKSCPVLTQMQNCQGNGRPDKDYENWRWKPNECDLPRFDPRKFLELMRGKTLAFIGDSVARNQMESMLCILWQAEVPKNRGNKRMQRYYFRSTSTMIVRIWSSWLVKQTTDAIDFAPAGVTKLHLDAPDEGFMEFVTEFDVIVLSSGHWFAKQSVYILNNEIVGGQLWWPDKSKEMKINNIEAFGISVETILSAMVTHPKYSGLTIVRSFSPDHYEGGAWNTGGSCTGKVRPANDSELVENGFTNIMHEKQLEGFNRAIKKMTNNKKLKMMDITEVFAYRHDGHPGPYRSLDPNKITKRGPDGRPPPQDCLHWCMPGPVDTWNEMVFEIIRREFDNRRTTS